MTATRHGMGYPWILFDADGTLFNYDAAEAAALEASLSGIGHPLVPEALTAYRRINGEMWREFERGAVTQQHLRVERFERFFDVMGIAADPARFSDDYLAGLACRTELIEGADTTVASLAKVCRLMLITNGIAEVQRPRFASSSIRNHFVDLVISEEVGAAKPDPRIFDAAFEKMKQPRKTDVLIVGDSLTSDIKGGNDYGIATCWFNPCGFPVSGGVDPTFEISRIDELLVA